MKIRPYLSAGLGALTMLGVAAAVPAARADTLRIGFDTEWSSLDPHYHSFPHNHSIARSIFDTLVRTSPELEPEPGVALSWRATDPLTWEFKLRPGVTFHDGTPLSGADAIASVRRIPAVPNSPGPLTSLVRTVASGDLAGPDTLVIRTSEPTPFLPALLANVSVIPAKLADAPTARFNSGTAAIGSGPYRFVRYVPGERLELTRNDAYWGPPPDWDAVTVRIVTNGAAREAALLARDLDFILSPTPSNAERLGSDPALALFTAVSTRITYLQANQTATPLPDMTGTDGRNPFADARVRRAVSLAIPRAAITGRVLEGFAILAGQIAAPGQSGYDPALAPERADPEAARRLLTEAGWPNGFGVTLSTPSDRNLNGVQVAQVIAAALTRIGIRTSVNAVPLSVYIAAWRKGTYSLYMHGAGPVPVTAFLVPQLVGTKDAKAAFGLSNESGYSNPGLDETMRAAFREIDAARRDALLRAAAQTIRDDTAIVPLHHEYVLWAGRKGLSFRPRSDTLTFVEDITRQR